MLERKIFEQDAVIDKWGYFTATGTIGISEQAVRCVLGASAVTLTLPKVAEAIGKFYCILLRSTSGGAVTVTHGGDSEDWTDQTLTLANDYVFLYSDGMKWIVLDYSISISDGTTTTKTTITDAQIKALAATQITLVAAPGAGKLLEFLGATLILTAGTSVLTESSDNLAIKYANAAGVAVSDTIETTGFIDQAVDTITRAVPVKDAIVASSAAVNKALVLDNIGDEIAGCGEADSVLTVYTTVRTLNL
jgi:hypothetical protein